MVADKTYAPARVGTKNMKINLEIFKMLSIFSVGFFLPWGANFVEVGGYPPNYFIAATLILTVFMLRTGIRIPFEFRIFILFLLLNIAVTTIIFGGNYLFLEHIQQRSVGPGSVYLTSDTNARIIVKFLFLISFLVIMSSVITRKNEWFVFAASFLAGLGVVCLLKIRFYMAVFPNIRFAGAYDDPNAFGIAACLAFFLAILLFDATKNIFLKIVSVSASVMFFAMLLLSQSRGSLVALACALFVMAKEKRLPVYKISLVVIVSFLIIFFLLKSFIPDRFLMPEAWAEDRGSRRLDIWTIYLSNAWRFFLTGAGFLRGKDVVSTGVLGAEYMPHNAFLEMFVEFGIIGFSLFCFVLKRLWVKLDLFPAHPPFKPALRAILISWAIGAFFISAYVLRETWFVFALIVTAPVLYSDNKIIKREQG